MNDAFQSLNNNRRAQIAAYCILVLAFLVPRLFQLDHFVAVDEVNWLQRSANFYSSFMTRDYSNTFVNRTPGVITTWIESAAFRIEMPYYGISKEAQRTNYYIFELSLTELGKKPLDILHVARTIMVLFLSGIGLVSFSYAVRLFGLFPSLIGFLLLAFDPFITGLTRISHLDAPQAFLMALSLLAFSSFVIVEERYLDLVVSGAAGGMALLAKLPGIFIIPVILGLVCYQLWRMYKTSQKEIGKQVRRMAFILFIWFLVFCCVFFVLWPAMWVDPLNTLSKVFVQVLRYSSTATETVGIGQINIPDDVEPFGGLSLVEPDYSLNYFFRYPAFFLWRTTPIVLAGILLLVFFSLQSTLKKKEWSPKLVGFWILLAIYTVGMTLPWKSSDKYYAPVFLLACLIAGLGWHLASEWMVQRTGKSRYGFMLLAAVLVLQLALSLNHFPYYFSYYNPLLGGTARASLTRNIGVGEGLDIAGRYLDSLEDSQDLRVMSFYGIGPFSYFFDGQVEAVFTVNEDVWTPDFVRTLQHMDYLVIYTNQKFRNGPTRLFELLEDVSPVYTVELHGAEYVWIYKPGDLAIEDEDLERR